MTPSGIEPATFRFVAQHLNHSHRGLLYIYIKYSFATQSDVTNVSVMTFEWNGNYFLLLLIAVRGCCRMKHTIMQQ